MSIVKHLIFDLDDTLLDTTKLLIPIKDSPEFLNRIKSPLPLMPGARENLEYLFSKYTLHLLTQGRPQLQKQKIQSLEIEAFFSSITIVDPNQHENKPEYFRTFCALHPTQPSLVMSIGNRKLTDLGPAKEVGFKTCWFAYGEHIDEESTSPFEKPDFIISNHFEMIKTCQL